MSQQIILKSILFLTLAVSFASPLNAEVRPLQVPGEGDSYTGLAFRQAPIVNLTLFHPIDSQFGRALFQPWNGSYWPTHKGMLAHRYMDRAFPESKTWSNNYHYYLSNPPYIWVSSGRVNDLAPSEKYDLLVGDSEWGLTRAMWDRGIRVMQSYGRVPTWFGICHGWSAAAHVRIPEPRKPVTLTDVTGQYPITFYPHDIKALLSYLWAESNPKSLFIGNRCKKTPTRDEFGRVVEPECLDSNPMTWHVSVVNRVGRDGDSLVFDSSGDSEVWNYALDSYYFRYFNPATLKPARHLDEAVIAVENFVADPYLSHRAPGTKYIVGVNMKVFFPAATEPREVAGTTTLYKDKTFTYDLELDENMNIIGGEWYTLDRPDFVWTFGYDGVARTTEDSQLATPWSFQSPMPADWAAAGKSAGRRGKVLATLVNGMAERSREH